MCTAGMSSMDFLIFEPTSFLAHWVGKRVERKGCRKGERGRGGEGK